MASLCRLLLALLLAAPLAARAADTDLILNLLDYVAVDYAQAVGGGRVRNPTEYGEMVEFTAQIGKRVQALPSNPASPALSAQAEALSWLVASKANPDAVADKATVLRDAIVAAYRLRLAPRRAPPLARAPDLFVKHCAGCHGAQGRGDGPAAGRLDPPPADFHNRARMDRRSVYGLYNTITLGVDGTSMAAFRELSQADRWALAFHVGNLGVPADRIAEGAARWNSGEAREVFPDLVNVATLSASEVAARFGDATAPVQAYLRAHPEVLQPSPLDVARRKLVEARAAYARGAHAAAHDAAVEGYLDGYERVEMALANLDGALMRETEREMIELRAAIRRGEAPQDFAARVGRVEALLAKAEARLGAGELSGGAAFAASLVILLREGLEAIVILGALFAFVLRTGRRDALAWMHAGWMGALVLGGVTWLLARTVADVPGASRELTEGIAALLAAVMLLYVGYWLHGRPYDEAWTRFLRERAGEALGTRTLWVMASVSFLAVYRELLEIVLLYEALLAQAGPGVRGMVLAGAAAGAAGLAALGYALLRMGSRLPMGAFFSTASGLMAVLAVILAGRGIAAMQGAGLVTFTRIGVEPFPLIGFYPSAESLAAQAVAILLVGLGYWASRPRSPRPG